MNKLKTQIFFFLSAALMMSSCVDKFLPENLDALGIDTRFTQDSYSPVLGRNTLMANNFNASSASQPLTFKIVNMRKYNGDPAPELTEPFPVSVWKEPYLGTEKSLEEIEAKRTTANFPLFSIRAHNGNFQMFSESNSSFIRTAPDSAYTFDVEVSNSGGTKYVRNMRLVPKKERPYEPSIFNEITGNATRTYVNPSRMSGIRGSRTSSYIGSGNVEIYFRKVVDDKGNNVGQGNSLKLIFKDSLYNDINPDKFNLTDWKKLVHGFQMEKTASYVKYNVGYPIPLIPYKTDYTTTDGTRAKLDFKYERMGYGNIREQAVLGFDFAIYEKGDWEIIFRFNGQSPKFEND